MDESTERRTQPAGRELSVLAFGDTMAEIEMAALDEARKFFGDGWRLHIEPSYKVFDVGPPADVFAVKYAERIAGKSYYARLTVLIVEPG